MARMQRIPEGAIISQIASVGTAQCRPINGDECDSWKTLGVAMIRIVKDTDEGVVVMHPLCKQHMHWYVDEVLFARDTDWYNKTGELGEDLND